MTPADALAQLTAQQHQHQIDLNDVKRRIDVAQQRLDDVERALAEQRAILERAQDAGYINGGPHPTGE